MGVWVTEEAARERFGVLFDQVDAAHAEMRDLCSQQVGSAFRTDMADRLETRARANRGLMYRVFGHIADPPDETAMAPVTINRLAARLRIPTREVKRRFKTAAKVLARRQVCGPPLPAGVAPSRRCGGCRNARRGSRQDDPHRVGQAAVVYI